jgi:hypothetical protein
MKLTVNNPFDTFYKSADDVIVFDDVIPEVYQNWLLDCIKNQDLKWHRKDHAISDLCVDDPRNGFCNFHYLYEIEQRELSTLTNAFMPLALQFRDLLKAECLLRMRVNCTPSWYQNQVQLPHIDSYVKNSWNVVYYLDESNGDTVIYNERTQDHREYVNYVKNDVWTVKQTVPPKKGRAVAFKGDLFHSSTLPVGTWRPVVNINVSEKAPSDPTYAYSPQ